MRRSLQNLSAAFMGGNSSYATYSNRSGHIGGFAEKALDPNCLAPQVFDVHGVLWSEGVVQDLLPLTGDTLAIELIPALK
jgi:hypothetical protein